MKSKAATLLVLLSLAPPAHPDADPPPSKEFVTFIGCPIYRDTDAGRKSGCWLAEDPATGIRYDVTDGPTKPQVGKVSFFEGVITNEPNSCGGVVLRPVRQAVLDDTCPQAIIPAEEFKGRRFVLPAETMQPTWIDRALPPPPYTTREFHIVFDFGNDFQVYQYAELILEKISLYVKASKPKAVIVTGYAATKPIEVSGRKLAEPLELAKSRANTTAESLRRLGVERTLIRIETQGDPQPMAGLATPGMEASKRRVTVRIEVDR
jgi:outer membrane protein OmpA-like peptidoglycan-associated protein